MVFVVAKATDSGIGAGTIVCCQAYQITGSTVTVADNTGHIREYHYKEPALNSLLMVQTLEPLKTTSQVFNYK